MVNRSRTRLGYLLAVAAALCWASLVVFGKLLIGAGLHPVTVVALRAGLAFVILALGLLVFSRRRLAVRVQDLPRLLACGALIAANFALYFLAFKHTSGSVALMLVATYPAFVAALAHFVLGERLDAAKGAALTLVLLGSLLVVQAYSPGSLRLNLIGAAAAVGAAVGLAAYSVAGKALVRRYDPLTVVVWGFGVAAVILLAVRAGDLSLLPGFPPRVWAGLVLTAVIPTVLAYICYVKAMTYLEATRVSLAESVEPAIGCALAWLLLGERMEPLQWAGAALLLGGVLVVQLGEARSLRTHLRLLHGDGEGRPLPAVSEEDRAAAPSAPAEVVRRAAR